ncbi:phospholipid transport system substrate-binding protein [Tepidimonas ignava]|uniref:Phospholipid transport system substrate-binding protein n=2 Tax=Tepidimonas ignava TaxID=114249 RepID=A0A4R3LFF2_9BURK|nr:ABC transporter substrate-binding protein [Tepidimonas ignava]TCS98682.1 phospholipid transport system substrate-binding protein [Tepidimonas ignava]TSE18524.1 putative phospholipid-binding protein MlaC [Tepidimonas ignava]
MDKLVINPMDVTVNARRRWLAALAWGVAGAAVLGGAPWARAQTPETPDALIQRVAAEVFDTVKRDPALRAGDIARISALVDTKLMPHVDFERMTASAVGRFWRSATPEQRQRLMAEFKTLLVRTYSGALTQINDQTLVVRPLRAAADATEVVVRSEIRGKGEPIQLDYRLARTPQGWKVYDLNVMGVWLVDTYRTQFAQEINARGIDGLIATLAERNRSNAQRS